MANKKNGKTEANSERRRLILEIAASQFARTGYAATTVRDIADEAGILSGSLYHHFASKEAIIREILEEYIKGLIASYDAIVEQNMSAHDTLHALIGAAFEMIAREPDSAILYQNEAPFLQTVSGFEFLKTQSQRIEAVWQVQVERGQAEGTIRPTLDPATTYRFIRDALWSVVKWYRPKGTFTLAEVQNQFIELMHGVVIKDD